MVMLKIALVDDEDVSIVRIKDLLQTILATYDTDYSIITFTDGNDLLNCRDTFDLLLLDIDMPTINGFELVEKYSKEPMKKDRATVIYISSYDDFVFESFKYSPLRFIRKNKLDIELPEAINAFFHWYNNEKDFFIFTERESNCEIKIQLVDIMYFEVFSHDIFLVASSGQKYSIKRIGDISLNVLEERYRNKGFIRSHKSFLVNYRHIFKIHDNKIFFTNDNTALISSRNIKEFKLKYQNYIMRG